MCDKIILLNGKQIKTVGEFEKYFHMKPEAIARNKGEVIYKQECLCQIDLDRYFKNDLRFRKEGGVWYENSYERESGKEDKYVLKDILEANVKNWLSMIDEQKAKLDMEEMTEANRKIINESIKMSLSMVIDIQNIIKRIN